MHCSSCLLYTSIREVGYRKADDFYIALGAAKVSPKIVVNKVMQRLKQGEAADGESSAADLLRVGRSRRRPTTSSGQYGIRVEGVDDVMLRLAKCLSLIHISPIAARKHSFPACPSSRPSSTSRSCSTAR